MKKGRHRRYEEARNLKRGPDLDIEALFTDLATEPGAVASVVDDDEADDIELDPVDEHDDAVGDRFETDDIEVDPADGYAGALVDERYEDDEER